MDFAQVLSIIDAGNLDKLRNVMNNHNFDINKEKDGWTFLQKACEEEQFEIVKYLLSFSNIDPNKKNKYGMTALHIAVESYNNKIVEALMEHDQTNPNILDNTENPDNTTEDIYSPLHRAVIEGYVDIVRIMLAKQKTNVNFTNDRGDTPLHLTTDTNVLSELLNRKDIDPNIRDKNGETPLHIFSYAENEEGNYFGEDLIEMLFEKRADVDTFIVNNQGETAYDKANTFEVIDKYEPLINNLTIKEQITNYRKKQQ